LDYGIIHGKAGNDYEQQKNIIWQSCDGTGRNFAVEDFDRKIVVEEPGCAQGVHGEAQDY
jgi:hypothetical protein